jgi:hypothetical protein
VKSLISLVGYLGGYWISVNLFYAQNNARLGTVSMTARVVTI